MPAVTMQPYCSSLWHSHFHFATLHCTPDFLKLVYTPFFLLSSYRGNSYPCLSHPLLGTQRWTTTVHSDANDAECVHCHFDSVNIAAEIFLSMTPRAGHRGKHWNVQRCTEVKQTSFHFPLHWLLSHPLRTKFTIRMHSNYTWSRVEEMIF